MASMKAVKDGIKAAVREKKILTPEPIQRTTPSRSTKRAGTLLYEIEHKT